MRLTPYRDDRPGLFTLQERMNRLFDSFFGAGEREAVGDFVMDIIETPENLQVKAELPGVDPKDIEISVVGDTLMIKGEKLTRKEDKGGNWHRRERTWGKFQRAVTLPMAIDEEHVEAVEEAGVLTIMLPKAEIAQPRRIEVKAK